MRQILLSIKPEFIEKIFSGEKEFEFRKNRCKSDVNKIIIYSTAPVKKVVGTADIEYIIEDTPSKVWERTQNKSGISYDFFNSYYAGCTKSVAYKLTNVKKYIQPKDLSDFGVSVPPQSFVYLPNHDAKIIKKKFKQIDLQDTFFDSLKNDYDNFDTWFNAKGDEFAYVYYADNSLKAFLYLKPENKDEDYSDITPLFLPKKRLKIGTFKVIAPGLNIGKEFLKITLNTAVNINAEEIYCTIPDLSDTNNPDKKSLIKMLKKFGFYLWGTKNNNESVYVCDIKNIKHQNRMN